MKINPEEYYAHHLGPDVPRAEPAEAHRPEQLQHPESATVAEFNPPLREDVQRLYERMQGGARVRRRDVIRVFDRGDRPSHTTLGGRYQQAKKELITHPEIGPRVRTDGTHSTTVYWIVDNEADDPDFRISTEVVKKTPKTQRRELSKRTKKKDDLLGEIVPAKYPPLSRAAPSRDRLVGIYSLYLYNKLGFEGVGVFDYLMTEIDHFHTVKDIAEAVYGNDEAATEKATKAATLLARDRFIKPYLDTKSYGGVIGARKPIALSSDVDRILFKNLGQIELQALKTLHIHRQGITVANLVRMPVSLRPETSHDSRELVVRALHHLAKKYPYHIQFSDQVIGNTLVKAVQLKRYRELIQK